VFKIQDRIVSILFGKEHCFINKDDSVGFFIEEEKIALLFLETLFTMFGVILTHADSRGIIYKFIF
jgi:hypothetical protein